MEDGKGTPAGTSAALTSGKDEEEVADDTRTSTLISNALAETKEENTNSNGKTVEIGGGPGGGSIEGGLKDANLLTTQHNSLYTY